MDTIFIPKNEALLALDLVAASIAREDASIALNESPAFVRLDTVYRLHGIDGKFSRTIREMLLDEGRRKVFTRQKLHVRMAACENVREPVIHTNDDLSE